MILRRFYLFCPLGLCHSNIYIKKPLLFEELLVQHCSMVIPHIGLQQDLKRFFVNRYLEKR